ncbi:hypothetical protein Tco_0679722 [Tanacetum coccineum]|uniref:Uncharacterized protein n=1 Tax=Tanacetum coccineum TaxID=301880 RepID=A0ABQ4XIM2_9ASTR
MLSSRFIHSGTIVDWSFFVNHGLARELVHEFFASIEFKEASSRYDPKFKGVEFRLGCETRTMSLLEFVKTAWMGFWPTIGDGEFVVGGTSVKKIRDPKIGKYLHFSVCSGTEAEEGLLERALVQLG